MDHHRDLDSPPIHDNSLTTVTAQDASNTSAKPHKPDDLDAPARIYTHCLRFRSVSRQLGGGSSPLIHIAVRFDGI
jgi:hypothetical protein